MKLDFIWIFWGKIRCSRECLTFQLNYGPSANSKHFNLEKDTAPETLGVHSSRKFIAIKIAGRAVKANMEYSFPVHLSSPQLIMQTPKDIDKILSARQVRRVVQQRHPFNYQGVWIIIILFHMSNIIFLCSPFCALICININCFCISVLLQHECQAGKKTANNKKYCARYMQNWPILSKR